MEAPQTVEVHGHARAVRVLGTGPTVLLLIHGVGSDGTTWDAVAPALAQRYTVVVPDLLGHGRSAKPRADYSIGGYANGMRDLLGVLDIDRATIIGHSFGGGVAMQFAYQFPDRTDRLGLIACGGLGPQVSVALRALTLPGASTALGMSRLIPAGVARATLRAARGLGLPAALAAELSEALAVHTGLRDPAARTAFLHALRHVVDWHGQVITMRDRAYLIDGLPTLVVWGDQDHVVPVEHAHIAAEALPGATKIVLPGVGHFPHREAPEAFVVAVADFVAQTEPKSWSSGHWREVLLSRAVG
jgi:pimeloyl-ACP methyl ester carboxylesterase